jgi:hypothetical protein
MAHAIGRWYRPYFRIDRSGGVNLQGTKPIQIWIRASAQDIQPAKQNVPDFTVMGRIARTGSSPEKLSTIKIARQQRYGNGTNGLYNFPWIAADIFRFEKGVVFCFASSVPFQSGQPLVP